MHTTSSSIKNILITGVIVFIGAFYIGYLYRGHQLVAYLEGFKPLRLNGSAYTYINPLLGTDSLNAFDAGLYEIMKKRINNRINDAKLLGMSDAAVYYRDLNSAVWFGVNTQRDFFPASLLKMTYAFAAYKEEEVSHGFLLKKITYTQKNETQLLRGVRADTHTLLQVGTSYSVADLIRIMLINSDNGARLLLDEAVDKKYITAVYKALGISVPDASVNFQISVEKYTLFFRLLYSATFLNEEHSEQFLSILTETDFPLGIRRFVPNMYPIAHKYGVYNLPKDKEGNELQELHDCGIVYPPTDAPYLMCIMTKGKDQQVLADFIAAVSGDVFLFTQSK